MIAGGDPSRCDRDDGRADASRRSRPPVTPGYPAGAGAVLIVELDGIAVQVAEDDGRRRGDLPRAAARSRSRGREGRSERALLWKGRKGAFAAMGRISPNYYVQDGVVPRTRLPEVLRRIDELGEEHGLRVGNVFHAGDGNLHPLVLYDDAVEGEAERAEELADGDPRRVHRRRRLAHRRARRRRRQGVLDAEDVLRARPRGDARLRRAFDPDGLANPGKVFPTPRLCGEVPGPYRAHPLERAGLAERF